MNAAEVAPGAAVSLSVESHVAVISFGTPTLNLLTSEVYRGIRAVLKSLVSSSDVRAVILCGAQARFSAGSDINELADLGSEAAERKVMLENLALHDLEAFPRPTIAAIEGFALGGGFELALACDLRIMGDDAQVGVPEAKIGGLASSGARRLTQLVGPSEAKRMLFFGSTLDAESAKRSGLVNWTSHPDKVQERARELAAELAQRSAQSIGLAKSLVRDAADGRSTDGFLDSVRAQEAIFEGESLLEGVAAFREKRTPDFVNVE
jgi:enoyl-CoA hydratase